MDNDSLSFGYTEIKLNAVWEGRAGGMRFNITILLYVLFLSIKYMHSIDNATYALLNMIYATSYCLRHYNELCKKNKCVCGVITEKYGNKIAQ